VPRADYGYDAPYALVMFTAASVVSAAAAGFFLWEERTLGALVAAPYCLFFLANAGTFLHATRRGKFVEWERILNGLALGGGEAVLDMGCGRGAVLIAVARRLATGRVTGVDVWNTMDQSGNAREVTLRNASIEGVAERVRIETGDMRALPFPDATFDVVVSSLAIHNIRSNDDRRRAIEEAFRVLRPGGRLAIADIRATRIYEETLRRLGATHVRRRRLGWRFWWGNPMAGTTLLTASKAPEISLASPAAQRRPASPA